MPEDEAKDPSSEQIEGESPEVVETPEAEPIPIEEWTPEQRAAWLKDRNKIPMREPEAKKASKEEAKPETEPEEPEEGEETPEKGAPEPRRHRKTAKERIEELRAEIQDTLRQRREARDELEGLRRQIAELQREPKAPLKPQTPADGRPVAPKMADFETFEDYQAAVDAHVEKLADWKVEQGLKQRTEAEARQRAETEQQQARGEWERRASAYRAKDPTFDIAVDSVGRFLTKVGPEVVNMVMRSEVGPEIVMHLAEDGEKEGVRLAQLGNPVLIAREIGKIEATLLASRNGHKAEQPATPGAGAGAKKVTAASPPVTELTTTKGAPPNELDAAIDEGDFGRFRKARIAQMTRR